MQEASTDETPHLQQRLELLWIFVEFSVRAMWYLALRVSDFGVWVNFCGCFPHMIWHCAFALWILFLGSRWNWARGNIMWGSIFVLFGIPPCAFWVLWVSCLRGNFLFFKVPRVPILWNFTERHLYFLVVSTHLLRNFGDHNSSEFGLSYLLPPSFWAWVFLRFSCEAYLVVL